jgi:predicted permease
MPLGFQPAGVVAASYDLGLERRGVTEGRAFQRRALDTAARIPGVIAAAYGNSTPLSIDQSNNTVYREGVADSRLARGWPSTAYSVSPGYFRVMGTRLVAGREFDWHDDARGPRVAIVNQTFAREVFGRPDAVGRRFVMRGSQTTEVVGIVEDGKYASLTESPRLALFTPSLQDYNGTTVLLVRTARPEAEMTAELRRTLAALDAGMPVYGAGSLSQMLGFAFFPSRAATLALSAFGVLAIMLAVTGIYGIAVYGVARRVREIGIRVAVGASPRQVLLFVFGRIAWLLAAGSAAGLALGAAAAKALASVVYQASARDPLVLAAVPAAMTLIGLAAVFGPAHKATSVAPLDALRSE